MNTPLVALDVGATKVACAIGLPHDPSTPPPWRGRSGFRPAGLHGASGFELLGSSTVPYRGSIEAWLGEPLVVGQAIEQALEDTAVTGEFHRALVAVTPPSLASERVRVSVALGDEPVVIRAHDLERLETSALNQVLGIDRDPLLVERLSCDGNGFEGVRDPCGLSATRLRAAFHVITMPIAARRALVQAVESAGLEVAWLTSTLPAAWAGGSDKGSAGARGVLLDVGGLTTSLGLFVDGVFHSAHFVPWGGVTLSAAIAKALQVTMDQAMTWSLQGTACRHPAVRTIIESHWGDLQQGIDGLLRDQPRPETILISGRGGLMDGFVEWVERTTQIPTSLCRSVRMTRLGDLPRQVGLTTAIGLLELATRTRPAPILHSPQSRLLDRLLDRTRTILTEYF